MAHVVFVGSRRSEIPESMPKRSDQCKFGLSAGKHVHRIKLKHLPIREGGPWSVVDY